MDIIIIRLCKNPNDYDSAIIRFLTYLLSHKFSVTERNRVLSQDYNIKMHEVLEGVDTMSGLGAAVRQEGRQEEKMEIAKNMLKSNLPILTIVQCTGLSKEEIEKLK